MNKLWIQLSAVFAGVVFVSVILISVSTRLYTGNNLPIAVDNLSNPVAIVEIIQEIYTETGELDVPYMSDVLDLFYLEETSTGFYYTLLNENGEVVQAPQLSLDKGLVVTRLNELPIRVNDQHIGTLVVEYVSPPSLLTFFGFDSPRYPRDFLPILLFVVVVTGLSSGILFARMLTAPLEDLANAVRSFNSNPEIRVEPAGSDEVREVATAFNEMADAVATSRRLRRQLVADVAHELRTPINQIQGALYALLDGIYPMTKEEIARLLDHTQNLTHIVNDLRETAQAEAGQLPMLHADVDLNTLLEDAIDEFKQTAQEKNIQLQLQAQTTATIHVDRDRMLQVLRNLLSNATRHTPLQGQITIKTVVGTENITLIVSDTGEGIPESALQHIFERFYRVDVARSRERGGTGIGLSITKSIVEAHNGTICAESTVGKGTTFTIVLPRPRSSDSLLKFRHRL